MPNAPIIHYDPNPLTPALNPEDAMSSILPVAIAPSETLAKGTVMGRITATGLWGPYDDTAVDGRQVARGLLRYAISTDGSANVLTSDEWGGSVPHGEIFTEGNYYTADLVGLDAAGIADLNGRLINAGGPNEIVHIG